MGDCGVKYTTQPPTAWWHADGKESLARTVHEQEPERKDTGLLDANGVKLWRIEESSPLDL